MREPKIGKIQALKGKRPVPFLQWKRHRDFPSLNFRDIRDTETSDALTQVPGRGQGGRKS